MARWLLEFSAPGRGLEVTLSFAKAEKERKPYTVSNLIFHSLGAK
jgi:hypothetical protein